MIPLCICTMPKTNIQSANFRDHIHMTESCSCRILIGRRCQQIFWVFFRISFLFANVCISFTLQGNARDLISFASFSLNFMDRLLLWSDELTFKTKWIDCSFLAALEIVYGCRLKSNFRRINQAHDRQRAPLCQLLALVGHGRCAVRFWRCLPQEQLKVLQHVPEKNRLQTIVLVTLRYRHFWSPCTCFDQWDSSMTTRG